MSIERTQTIQAPLIWSIVGPASVLFSTLLLVIKESPFYIDLSVVAMTGLFLSWRWKRKGAIASAVLLSSVFAYDYFIEMDSIGLWDFGLLFSLYLSFLITALASAETLELMKSAANAALAEVEEWEKRLSSVLGAKEAIEVNLMKSEGELATIKELENTARSEKERYQRLLAMARDEMFKQTSLHEQAEARAQSFKLELAKAKEELQDSRLFSRAIQQGAERELERLQKELLTAEENMQDLAGQLSDLAEKLKDLQSEKDQLEKALDDALKQPPVPDGELQGGKYVGLYKQLREQFGEKQKLLDETRKALFVIEQELLTQAKLREEHIEEEMMKLLNQYSLDIKRYESDISLKDQEIQSLEELIRSISR